MCESIGYKKENKYVVMIIPFLVFLLQDQKGDTIVQSLRNGKIKGGYEIVVKDMIFDSVSSFPLTLSRNGNCK